MTLIQRKVLAFIQEETAANGAPPTLRALCARFGFRAIGTVQGHVAALIRKGFLEKTPGQARGLRLAKPHRAGAVSVPVLGEIAAGTPREAIELATGATPLPERFARSGPFFALRVSGESMTGAGINDGDLVIARAQSSAETGDIVVALIDGAATVKRFERRGGRSRLLAENPAFPPIEVRSPDAVIQGKVVAVQRYYE